MHQIDFDRLVPYDSESAGITIPTVLGFSDRQVSLEAKVDTGASVCIFEGSHADALGLDIESGLPLRISTATGTFLSYGFRVTLTVAEMQFDSLVYFAAVPDVRRNVLGRHGWLELVKLGLLDYERKLYLSRY
jgi:hypothetical protein